MTNTCDMEKYWELGPQRKEEVRTLSNITGITRASPKKTQRSPPTLAHAPILTKKMHSLNSNVLLVRGFFIDYRTRNFADLLKRCSTVCRQVIPHTSMQCRRYESFISNGRVGHWDMQGHSFDTWLAYPGNEKCRDITSFKPLREALNEQFSMTWLSHIFPWAYSAVSFDDCTEYGKKFMKCMCLIASCCLV